MNCTKFLESKKKFPNIKKLEHDGFNIMIGKDAESNDHLTFNMAEDNDLWFHVKGSPGSHVVLKINDKLPIETVVKFVAELAKKNSKAKNTEGAHVVYCKRKFVKKNKGMNAGQVKVDYKNAQTIII